MPTIICMEDGGEPYHFCIVQFADTLQAIDTFSTCPAQILGFSKYESRQIPMFVCQDYGNDGLDYFCTLPYKRWDAYFKNRLSN